MAAGKGHQAEMVTTAPDCLPLMKLLLCRLAAPTHADTAPWPCPVLRRHVGPALHRPAHRPTQQRSQEVGADGGGRGWGTSITSGGRAGALRCTVGMPCRGRTRVAGGRLFSQCRSGGTEGANMGRRWQAGHKLRGRVFNPHRTAHVAQKGE